jgi:signal transduction histidine kinase
MTSWPSVRRWSGGWPRDVAISVLLVALSVLTGWRSFRPGAFQLKQEMALGGTDAWQRTVLVWWVATAVGAAGLLLLSRLPVVALVAGGLMTLVHASGLLVPAEPIDLAAPAALAAVAVLARRAWLPYAALAACLVAAFLLPIGKGRPFTPWTGTLVPALAVVLAWFVGLTIRARRVRAEERAQDMAYRRRQEAQIAAADERARITREMHDIVAHGLSVIVIQSQAARTSLHTRPDRVEQSLTAILSTSRTALAELRRLLEYRPGEQSDAETAPSPGVRDLRALADRVRAAGLPLTVAIEEPATGFRPAVDLAVYRVAQEALTNVLKHAGDGLTAALTVCCRPGGIEVTVEDTGPGAGPGFGESGGNGLRGMRERVAMLGGVLEVGNAPEGGFRVRARIPCPAEGTA